MDIMKIRDEASRLYQANKSKIIPTFYMISCLTFCFQIFQTGFAALIGRIVLITIAQGYVYISLKLLRQQNLNDLSIKDALVGLRHLFEYLPGYITRMIVIYVPTFICLIPMIVSINDYNNIYDLIDEIVFFFLSKGINFTYISNYLPDMNKIGIVCIILALLVYGILSILFTFVPYLIEDYDYAWNEALVKSYDLMIGHIEEYIRLMITFIPKYIYYNFIILGLYILCSLIPFVGYGVYLVSMLMFEIVIFLGEYHITMAIFYSKIRDEKNESYNLFHIREI